MAVRAGLVDRGVFLERLQNMIAAHSAHLRRLQAEAQRQAETTQLVQEQDMEYIAAMEADRQRVRGLAVSMLVEFPPRSCEVI
jgi:hypothetical protein